MQPEENKIIAGLNHQSGDANGTFTTPQKEECCSKCNSWTASTTIMACSDTACICHSTPTHEEKEYQVQIDPCGYCGKKDYKIEGKTLIRTCCGEEKESWEKEFEKVVRPFGAKGTLCLVPEINQSYKVWALEQREQEIKSFIRCLLHSQATQIATDIEKMGKTVCEKDCEPTCCASAVFKDIQKIMGRFIK